MLYHYKTVVYFYYQKFEKGINIIGLELTNNHHSFEFQWVFI